MTIREASASDATVLGDLLESAVRAAGPLHYTPEQVEAWAAAADDREAFGRRMLEHQVFMAEDETGPTGFVMLGRGGHIGALYVRGDRQGRGIGRALLTAVLDAAREAGVERLHAEASEFSFRLFEWAGFTVIGRETVERRGVAIERYLVERVPAPDG